MRTETELPGPDVLAARAQAGSRESFDRLVERFEGPLYGFLCLRTGNATDAEELTQETFLRAWRKIRTFDPAWSFSTWLFTIGRHLAVSHLRKARPIPAGEEAMAGVEARGDPATELAAAEEHSRIWDLAGRILTESQRSALWLRFAEELSVEEIAQVLGKSRTGVRVLLFRARRRLAQSLAMPGAEGGRRSPVESEGAGWVSATRGR